MACDLSDPASVRAAVETVVGLGETLAGIIANALHPGVIQTKLGRHLDDYDGVLDSIGRDKLETVGQGAATQVYLAVHPDVADKTGLYFDSCQVKEPSKPAQDEALADRLWAESERIVASLQGRSGGSGPGGSTSPRRCSRGRRRGSGGVRFPAG